MKGTIQGNVDAMSRIELFSGAQIIGNIRTPDLIVQSGSRLTGKCEMPDAEEIEKAEYREGDVDNGSAESDNDA